MPKPESGKTLWLWEPSSLPPPTQMAQKAADLGCTGLLIKGFDGGNIWPTEAWIMAAHAAGLDAGVWGYSYGRNPRAEALAARVGVVNGADYLLIDAEVEYGAPGGADRARELQGFFRSVLGADVLIGFTSFGLPDDHATFPWAEFASWCSFLVPQIYWVDFRMAPARALRESLSQCARYGIPVIPAGQLITDSGARVQPGDVIAFAAAAKAAGCEGVSFWRAGNGVPEDVMEAVAAIKWEVDILPATWKTELEQWAKEHGLITQDHDPDSMEPGWFALAVAKNLYVELDGRISALEGAVKALQPS